MLDRVCESPAEAEASEPAVSADVRPAARSGPSRAGLKWTRDEVAELRRLIGAGVTVSSAARTLERPVMATGRKLHDLGLGPGVRGAWGDEEQALLREMIAAGRTGREIATRLGRTVDMIRQYARRHGLKLPHARPPGRTRGVWTAAEDAVLTATAEAGGTVGEAYEALIAAGFERTRNGTTKRAYALGLTFRSGWPTSWTAAAERQARALIRAGRCSGDVARALGDARPGTTEDDVRRLARVRGLTLTRPGPPVWGRDRLARLRTLAEQGATMRAAAAVMGVPVSSVQVAAKRYDVRFAGRGRVLEVPAFRLNELVGLDASNVIAAAGHEAGLETVEALARVVRYVAETPRALKGALGETAETAAAATRESHDVRRMRERAEEREEEIRQLRALLHGDARAVGAVASAFGLRPRLARILIALANGRGDRASLCETVGAPGADEMKRAQEAIADLRVHLDWIEIEAVDGYGYRLTSGGDRVRAAMAEAGP